jgi:hypothetical protein
MKPNHPAHSASPRREAAARRAFFLWMAAYVAVIVAIAALHSFGGTAATPIDVNGMRTQQAKVTGPQSAVIGHPVAPQAVSFGLDG